MATKRRPKRIQIDASVLADVEKHSYSNLEAEVGGMLFGKVVDDTTKISGFIPALKATAEQISLTFTHEVWEEILREGDRTFPGDQIVGWYHTHPSFGVFLSEYDLFIQTNFFGSKGQLALVVDPIAGKMGWFESSDQKAVLICEELTKTGPKPKQTETRPKTVKSTPAWVVSLTSLSLGACLGAAVAMTNIPPDLSSRLFAVEEERNYFYNLVSQASVAPTLVYTCVEGETLESLVEKFYGPEGQTETLKQANPDVDWSKLDAGAAIRIPEPMNVSVEFVAPQPSPEPSNPTPSDSSSPESNPTKTPTPTPTD